MQQRTITLASQALEIAELPARKNQAWRDEFDMRMQPVLHLIEQAGQGMEINNSEDLLRLVHQLWPVVISSPALLAELVQAYAPNQVTAEVLDQVYDSEVIDAFIVIVGLAFPFGALVRGLTSLASGSAPAAPRPTSMSSASRNGARDLPTSWTQMASS